MPLTIPGFMPTTAKAQTEATCSTQKAGAARAKVTEIVLCSERKPSLTGAHVQAISDMSTMQADVSAVAAATDLSRQTVYRIQVSPDTAAAMLAVWNAVM